MNTIKLKAGMPDDANRDYLPEEIKGSDIVVNENGNNSQPYPKRLKEYHGQLVDGQENTWYEYVPESAKDNAPLVVCMHGRGGTAESFISLSGMSRVAEERGFITVFPEACVYQQRPGGLRNILLWNGFYEDEKTDDTGFILKMIDDVKSRHSIDETRNSKYDK